MKNRAYLNKKTLGLAILLVTAGPKAGGAEPRYSIAIQTNYEGANAASYQMALDKVQAMARTTQLEVSSALGLLRYQEGFRHPLRIRFEDNSLPDLKNRLAFVRLGRTWDGFAQELVINVEAIGKPLPDWLNFDTIFAHEMTHAALNDAVGGDASVRIPPWVQEGLAQFISKEGDPRLKDLGEAVYRSQVRPEWFDLDHPLEATAYPAFYLAIRYLESKHTINAVQALVRHLIEGRPIEDAVHESTGLSLEEFKKKVSDYSVETVRGMARPDGQIR